MASRDALIAHMDALLDVRRFTDYAPIGLQVEGRRSVRKVALGVSASLDLFRAARKWRADMILVHHGMFWNSESRVLRGPLKQRVRILLESEISLVAYHLPLDAHPECGNNALFAKGMGWREIEPFGDYHGNLIGFRGAFDPMDPGQFLRKAARFYGLKPPRRPNLSQDYPIVNAPPSIRAFLGGKPTITTAAVVSGGAWDMIDQAGLAGIDCFVTGNADEPVFHWARELGIHFMAFGHHATEKAGVLRLGEILAREFDIETRFFDAENPL